jgi:hypothetical protein
MSLQDPFTSGSAGFSPISSPDEIYRLVVITDSGTGIRILWLLHCQSIVSSFPQPQIMSQSLAVDKTVTITLTPNHYSPAGDYPVSLLLLIGVLASHEDKKLILKNRNA